MKRLILVAACALAYGNSFSAALVFDSPALTFEDARVQNLDVKSALGTNYWGARFDSGLYRPMATLTYIANYWLHGETRTGYHVVNFALHVGAVLAAYAVVGIVAPAAAFWASLLWAVHPLGTEAVTNIAGRPDLMATLCVLLGFLAYQKRWLVALAGVATVGMFSKESAVVLLGMVLLYDAWSRCRPWLTGIIAITIPAAAITTVHFALPMARPFVDNPLVSMGEWGSRMMALRIAGRMIGLWFWPATLSADYSFNQIPLTAAIPWFAGVLVAALAVVFIRPRSQAAFWTLLLAGAMLPTSNLILKSGSIMAERFMYLPGLAIAVLVVLAAQSLDRRVAAAALTVACVALTCRTVVRNADYASDLQFWEATAAASPGSFKARSQYAAELASAGRIGDAVVQADKAVAILKPVPARDNVALSWTQAFGYYDSVGRKDDARMAAGKVAEIYNALEEKKHGR